MPVTAPAVLTGTVVPTRVLAVGVDAAVIPSLRKALPASPLRWEMATDLLAAIHSLTGEEWDIVVAGLGGESSENELRMWLKALEQARGHPRFIAVMQQPASAQQPSPATPEATLAEVEAQHIRRVLESTGGRVMEAARILGVHRNTLARKLKALKAGNGKESSSGVDYLVEIA